MDLVPTYTLYQGPYFKTGCQFCTSPLRVGYALLLSKGYTIIGEFSCKGFNTNSFLKYFGGMNKGKPDSDDLTHAKEFALNLLHVRSHQDVDVRYK